MRAWTLWKRLLIGIGAPAVILLALLNTWLYGNSIDCAFWRITGLYCPGCGSGRELTALLHGRFRELFAYNILFFPLGIPAAGILAHEYLRLVFPRLAWKPVHLPQAAVVGVAALIAAFWILRNVPALSFLAPS